MNIKKNFPTLRLIKTLFQKGDYVTSVNHPEKEFRVFNAFNHETITIIELTDVPTKEIEYIIEHQDNLNLIKQSPLKYFKPSTEVYVKESKEKDWIVTSIAPSALMERMDVISCYKGTPWTGNVVYKNFLTHDIIPAEERICFRGCEETLHYSTHKDCPVCRYYICNQGHCECNK
ncbi:hypothetical protein COE86_04190 [Bacillus toyonensis]|uniref:hypothetical protein n=1 Tax=Bacillus toyonensis TaxID=155322 RepID=UPI000BFE4873|nr:hypothetical protein [Bacillus toyonensis]PHB39081.1 hypothetical protein COE86_04190 [Bacillus toyonensis]